MTPLRDAGLTKEQIRAASARLGAADLGQAGRGLPVARGWPTASRSARSGWPGSSGRRSRCAARSSAAGVRVRDLRVRDLGDVASIELDGEALAAAPGLPAVTEAALAAGFPEARVDPKGFRSGSMNERLPDPERFR